MAYATRHMRPRDIIWDKRCDTPAVMQMNISPTVRITYNPDDDMFYVEQQEETYGDWETVCRRNNDIRGWHNAKYTARKLAKR